VRVGTYIHKKGVRKKKDVTQTPGGGEGRDMGEEKEWTRGRRGRGRKGSEERGRWPLKGVSLVRWVLKENESAQSQALCLFACVRVCVGKRRR
jgi:hypothetical protein